MHVQIHSHDTDIYKIKCSNKMSKLKNNILHVYLYIVHLSLHSDTRGHSHCNTTQITSSLKVEGFGLLTTCVTLCDTTGFVLWAGNVPDIVYFPCCASFLKEFVNKTQSINIPKLCSHKMALEKRHNILYAHRENAQYMQVTLTHIDSYSRWPLAYCKPF